MKRWISKLAAVALLACGLPVMASEDYKLDKFPAAKMTDMAALQSGAKLFVNYCLNCHGASAMRYNRLRDIGLTDDLIKQNLLFTTDKVGETMSVAMSSKDAKEWFGATPPDLSVIARARSSTSGSGADWLYTYLRSFYVDPSRPTGWNNVIFPNVGMPHVLWELQGKNEATYKKVSAHGAEHEEFDKFVSLTPGQMKPAEYDEAIANLVAFMAYMAEPAQETRKKLGVAVLIFLGLFTFVAWRLNAAYWKDIK